MPRLSKSVYIYLPPLGIDLNERFDTKISRPILPATGPAFAPSTQAILIAMLLPAEGVHTWSLADLGVRAGVSTMTVSRAVRELAAVDVIEPSGIRDKPQVIALAAPPREIWKRVQGLLRSPVRRIGWVPESAIKVGEKRLAGLEALAHHTLLAAPSHKSYAMDYRLWSNIDLAMAIPEPDDGFIECQVWNYPANLQPNSDCVDPLSLALSSCHF